MANGEYVCRKVRLINMENYKVSYNGDTYVENIHHMVLLTS